AALVGGLAARARDVARIHSAGQGRVGVVAGVGRTRRVRVRRRLPRRSHDLDAPGRRCPPPADGRKETAQTMAPLLGEVWFWSLLSFLLGALLTWVLLVRSLQQRANHLEQQLHEVARGTQRAQPGQAEPGGRPQQAPEYRQSSSSVFDEPVPPTRRHDWL